LKHTALPRLQAFAKRQRRDMTRAEAQLWQALRNGRLDGWNFKRQVVFGRYIADFSCAKARLIIEADGEPHDGTEQRLHDAERDDWFRNEGFTVLRFKNEQVLGGLNLVVRDIRNVLAGLPSPVTASPRHPLPERERAEGKA
jgi:very-short-patch-repair endonuclease